MKKNYISWIIFLLLLIFIAMMFLPKAVGASNGLPESVVVFKVEDHVCVLSDVGLECFCPCDNCEFSLEANISPTAEKLIPSETVYPTDIPKPTNNPQPTKTPKPTKTEKSKCNSGRGNGSEGILDCDPGNSGKNRGGD